MFGSVPAPYLQVSLDSVERGQRSERREMKIDDGIASFCTRSKMLLKILREKLKSTTISLSMEHVGLFFKMNGELESLYSQ